MEEHANKNGPKKEKMQVVELKKNTDGTYEMVTQQNGTLISSRLYVFPDWIASCVPVFVPKPNKKLFRF